MPLLTSLTHYWKLDESSGNASDSVGGTTLTNTGTMTYAAAKINNGASTDTGKYLTATDPSFSEGANMSWNFWCKPSSTPTDFFVLTKRNTTGNQRSFRIGNAGTSTELQVSISSDGTADGSASTASGAFDTAAFHMFTVTFDGSQASGSRCKIYKDTVDITSTDATPATCFNSTADFYIGANQGGGLNFLGLIDEVGTWSKTLSTAEISQLYNGGAGLSYPFTTETGGFFLFMPN